MRKVFVVTTGKAVNNGDIISVEGKNITITDFNIPTLLADGILTFDAPIKKSTNETPKQKNTTKHSLFDDLVISWCEKHSIIKKEDRDNLVKILTAANPVGFIGMLLKEAASQINYHNELLDVMYGFDVTTGKIVAIHTAHMKYPHNIALFENEQILKAVIIELSDIINVICPNVES